MFQGKEEFFDKPESTSSLDSKAKKKSSLKCKHCRHPITSIEHLFTKDNKEEHVFINPHGVIYHIGCFEKANGCDIYGEPQYEYSWFNGFLWSLALCGECCQHLGWYFTSDKDDEFFGLILDRLCE